MPQRQTMQIFRLEETPLLEETDLQPLTSSFSPAEAELWGRKMEAGYNQGQVARVVVRVPGLTILHIWNKKGYPTPRHAHNADCHYIVLGGSISLGAETLSPGDGFFVPADMPYTYKVGPEGSEILEIRREDNWDLKLLAKNPAYFEKAVQAITTNIAGWQVAKRPSIAS